MIFDTAIRGRRRKQVHREDVRKFFQSQTIRKVFGKPAAKSF